jgi:hypothetical protein
VEVEPQRKPKQYDLVFGGKAEAEVEPKSKPKLYDFDFGGKAEAEVEPKSKPKRKAQSKEDEPVRGRLAADNARSKRKAKTVAESMMSDSGTGTMFVSVNCRSKCRSTLAARSHFILSDADRSHIALAVNYTRCHVNYTMYYAWTSGIKKNRFQFPVERVPSFISMGRSKTTQYNKTSDTTYNTMYQDHRCHLK